MKKFILIYHSPSPESTQETSLSAEEQSAILNSWNQWAQNCGEHLADMGAPLSHGTELDSSGNVYEREDFIGGYSIIEADDLESVKALLEGHPHYQASDDNTIGIYELLSMPAVM